MIDPTVIAMLRSISKGTRQQPILKYGNCTSELHCRPANIAGCGPLVMVPSLAGGAFGSVQPKFSGDGKLIKIYGFCANVRNNVNQANLGVAANKKYMATHPEYKG